MEFSAGLFLIAPSVFRGQVRDRRLPVDGPVPPSLREAGPGRGAGAAEGVLGDGS